MIPSILEIGSGRKIRVDAVTIDKSIFSLAGIIRDVAKRGIPFSDNTFDLVEAYEVLEHIEEYEDLVFLLNEICRVLKDGGTFKFSVPNGMAGMDHMTHVRIFTENSFRYLTSGVDMDYDYMRQADGIRTNFAITCVVDGPTLRFTAVAKKNP